MATNRVTTEGLEVLRDGPAQARVTTEGMEVLHSGNVSTQARVTSLGMEVLHPASNAKVRVTSQGLEVLRSVADAVAVQIQTSFSQIGFNDTVGSVNGLCTGVGYWTMASQAHGQIADPNLKLLMNLEGTNGSTGAPGMADDTGVHGTATVDSAAQISTAQFKFGASSLLLNGTTDSIRFPDHADWHLGTSPFSIECFIRPASVTGTHFIIGQFSSGAPNLGWQLWLNGAALSWNVSTTGSDNLADMSGGTVVINTQTCVCVSFDGIKYRLFVDGVMVASSTTLRNIYNPGVNLCIGSNAVHNAFWFNGWIDAIQFYKGVAKHASDSSYTVQTAAITNLIPDTDPNLIQIDFGYKVKLKSWAFIKALGTMGDWDIVASNSPFTSRADAYVPGNGDVKLSTFHDTVVGLGQQSVFSCGQSFSAGTGFRYYRLLLVGPIIPSADIRLTCMILNTAIVMTPFGFVTQFGNKAMTVDGDTTTGWAPATSSFGNASSTNIPALQFDMGEPTILNGIILKTNSSTTLGFSTLYGSNNPATSTADTVQSDDVQIGTYSQIQMNSNATLFVNSGGMAYRYYRFTFSVGAGPDGTQLYEFTPSIVTTTYAVTFSDDTVDGFATATLTTKFNAVMRIDFTDDGELNSSGSFYPSAVVQTMVHTSGRG